MSARSRQSAGVRAEDKDQCHGAINILGLTRRVRAKILQTSTSEEYTDPAVRLRSEAYLGKVNPIGPRSCHDKGERCAETQVPDFRRQRKLRIKAGQIFHTFGPQMHPNDGWVAPNFIVQALKGGNGC